LPTISFIIIIIIIIIITYLLRPGLYTPNGDCVLWPTLSYSQLQG